MSSKYHGENELGKVTEKIMVLQKAKIISVHLLTFTSNV